MKPVLPASISVPQVGTVGPEEYHAWSTEAAKTNRFFDRCWNGSFKKSAEIEGVRTPLQLHYTKVDRCNPIKLDVLQVSVLYFAQILALKISYIVTAYLFS